MFGRSSSWRRLATVVGLVCWAVAISGSGPALAGCHRFSLEVSPAQVSEGAKVTVKVSRDGSVDPSSIDVETIDDTAAAGQDFGEVKRTISFTDDTSQSFDIAIANDTANERSETFKIHLSNPQGCAANTNFDVADDVVVTIAASDAPGSSAPTVTGAAPTVAPTTPQPQVTPAPTTTDTLPDEDLLVEDDDGVSSGAIIAAIVVALAAATAGFVVWRRRQLAERGPDDLGPPRVP